MSKKGRPGLPDTQVRSYQRFKTRDETKYRIYDLMARLRVKSEVEAVEAAIDYTLQHKFDMPISTR